MTFASLDDVPPRLERINDAAQNPLSSDIPGHLLCKARIASRSENSDRRSERWGGPMTEAQALDDDIPVDDHGGAAISAATVDDLLSRLKPAQASVIRLVKLQGLSIEHASGATGQSAALVKVNIHRGLKKLAALVACGVEADSI